MKSALLLFSMLLMGGAAGLDAERSGAPEAASCLSFGDGDGDETCDDCSPVAQFDVQPVPGTGFVVDPLALGMGFNWVAASSAAGICNQECVQTRGCKGSGYPGLGYVGAGIQVCSVPAPPVNCVGSGVACWSPNSIRWGPIDCCSAGPWTTVFEIYQNGILVATAKIRGACNDCYGQAPAM